MPQFVSDVEKVGDIPTKRAKKYKSKKPEKRVKKEKSFSN